MKRRYRSHWAGLGARLIDWQSRMRVIVTEYSTPVLTAGV